MQVTLHHAIPSLLLCAIFDLHAGCSAKMAHALSLPPHMTFAQTCQTDVETLKETMEDVKKSGYYFMICNNIEEAWRMCDPNVEHEEDSRLPVYDECSEEDVNCEHTNHQKETKCRKDVLLYLANMYHTETVWEALTTLEDERKWLVDKCSTIFLASGDLPPFPLAVDDDAALHQVLASEDWENADDGEQFELDQAISLDSETKVVNGKFTQDLDLFYTDEQVRNLFDYSFAHYKKICSLARTCLMTDNISEVNDLTAALTETEEFNYISECGYARNTLFAICSFSTYFDVDEQNFIANHKHEFEQLFS